MRISHNYKLSHILLIEDALNKIHATPTWMALSILCLVWKIRRSTRSFILKVIEHHQTVVGEIQAKIDNPPLKLTPLKAQLLHLKVLLMGLKAPLLQLNALIQNSLNSSSISRGYSRKFRAPFPELRTIWVIWREMLDHLLRKEKLQVETLLIKEWWFRRCWWQSLPHEVMGLQYCDTNMLSPWHWGQKGYYPGSKFWVFWEFFINLLTQYPLGKFRVFQKLLTTLIKTYSQGNSFKKP